MKRVTFAVIDSCVDTQVRLAAEAAAVGTAAGHRPIAGLPAESLCSRRSAGVWGQTTGLKPAPSEVPETVGATPWMSPGILPPRADR